MDSIGNKAVNPKLAESAPNSTTASLTELASRAPPACRSRAQSLGSTLGWFCVTTFDASTPGRAGQIADGGSSRVPHRGEQPVGVRRMSERRLALAMGFDGGANRVIGQESAPQKNRCDNCRRASRRRKDSMSTTFRP